jgi:xanthine dehydrogenase small subunit
MEFADRLGEDKDMRTTIITNVNGRDISIADAPPEQMALAWLRSQGFISVKEGCGEGDCGACTIALGRPTEQGLEWQAVASCLLFLPMLDGCAVLTAEGLTAEGLSAGGLSAGGLTSAGPGCDHPVQKAMAEGYGTQCGFCSPGITMSLFALARQSQEEDDWSDETVFDALAGNLCRCTGYRPIVEIARGLPHLGPAGNEILLARKLSDATGEPLVYQATGRTFFAPTNLGDALAFRAEHPDAWVLAGGTDLGLFVTKRGQRPKDVLSLGRVAELAAVSQEKGCLRIGATVPYTKILAAVRNRHPELAKLIRRIGATQVRNQATFGGNLGTASPIGDSMPALIALDAQIEVASSTARRVMAAETFVTGYRATQLAADELITAVRIPDLPPRMIFRAYKIAKRKDQDISTLSAAFRLDLKDGRVASLRAAFGGAAAKPVRATHLEEALVGSPWTTASLLAAQSALAEDIAPQDDLRGSADYRRKLAANLVTRLWHETAEPADTPISLELL